MTSLLECIGLFAAAAAAGTGTAAAAGAGTAAAAGAGTAAAAAAAAAAVPSPAQAASCSSSPTRETRSLQAKLHIKWARSRRKQCNNKAKLRHIFAAGRLESNLLPIGVTSG